MASKRLQTFLFISLCLHLGFALVLPWARHKKNSVPPVFEVTWLAPTPLRHRSTPPKARATPSRRPPQKVRPRPLPTLPNFAIHPAPLGADGGQLPLGKADLSLVQGELPIGFQVNRASEPTGSKPTAKPGQPNQLAGTQVVPNRLTAQAGTAVWKSKIQIQSLAKQRPKPGPVGRIAGEAKGRKLIYIPKPTELNLEQNLTVTLRFIVFADGSVGQILVVKKSNPQFEAMAVKRLSQFRFAPKPDSPTQTGEIRFTLQRNLTPNPSPPRGKQP